MAKQLKKWRRKSGNATLTLYSGLEVGKEGFVFEAEESDIPKGFRFLVEEIIEEAPPVIKEAPVPVEEKVVPKKEPKPKKEPVPTPAKMVRTKK